MHKTFAILALPLAVAASELEAQAIDFKMTILTSTSLSECMEALEHGTHIPAISSKPGDTFNVDYVVYDGHFFGFTFDLEKAYRCLKISVSEVPTE